jgi:hypothetical protein
LQGSSAVFFLIIRFAHCATPPAAQAGSIGCGIQAPLRLLLMFRVVLLSCLLLLLFTATGTSAFAQADARRAPVEWMNGYTLVLVAAETKSDLAEARNFIAASGGTVAVVLPPHAIFGWITPAVEARIVGKHHIRAVHRSVINAPPAAFRDRETRMAINLYNDIASGRSARRQQRDAARQAGP